jgi:uncharacterized membrane protein YcgQ (UPF0703/DUF1980 family)
MTIHYTTNPQTFEELVDSCRGQLERLREVSISNEILPDEEKVVITTESFLDTLEQIERLQYSLSQQAEINMAIQQVFLQIFDALGIEITELEENDDEDE